jgi:FlaA1/EpsC-like NDP-sugar epimerase
MLVLVEQNEFALYKIHQELLSMCSLRDDFAIQIVPLLASVVNEGHIRQIIRAFPPHIIFHAAAYKHVPLVEANIAAGIKNNVFGTLVMAKIAAELMVPKFVLISTDKAVRPTNVMGASKRLAEMVLQALSATEVATQFSMVRFGNVLNSSGSVVPKFSQQIKDGGPITVTDFRMTRYFMTIPEAAQLVIQASALASGGDVFLLDMGTPVRIVELARNMVELSGLEVRDALNPEGDIEICETGLRPGEKLYEELLIDGSPKKTVHLKIYKSYEEYQQWDQLNEKLSQIDTALIAGNESAVLGLLKQLVVGYQPSLGAPMAEE